MRWGGHGACSLRVSETQPMPKSTPESVALPQMDLGEQAAFLRSVLEGSTEYAIVAKDLEGRILAWNEGAKKIYGYEPADVFGKSAFLLHHPEDIASGRASQFLEQARAAGKWEGRI